jgi:hypothetical protein
VNLNFKADKNLFDEKQVEVLKTFIDYLHNEIPLDDVTVEFVNQRQGTMTTGVRQQDGSLKILAGGRMLLDVLRTLSHEWVHEGQHQILGWKIGGDEIGGPFENQANSLAGVYLKKFQVNHPEFMEILYK